MRSLYNIKIKKGKHWDLAEISEDELKPKTHTIYEKIFFAAIKEMNDKNQQGQSKIVQVNDTEAILIHWSKVGWSYDIYPFTTKQVKNVQ